MIRGGGGVYYWGEGITKDPNLLNASPTSSTLK